MPINTFRINTGTSNGKHVKMLKARKTNLSRDYTTEGEEQPSGSSYNGFGK
jgi:hypothetical protein